MWTHSILQELEELARTSTRTVLELSQYILFIHLAGDEFLACVIMGDVQWQELMNHPKC